MEINERTDYCSGDEGLGGQQEQGVSGSHQDESQRQSLQNMSLLIRSLSKTIRSFSIMYSICFYLISEISGCEAFVDMADAAVVSVLEASRDMVPKFDS
jgi:hypothetical protein